MFSWFLNLFIKEKKDIAPCKLSSENLDKKTVEVPRDIPKVTAKECQQPDKLVKEIKNKPSNYYNQCLSNPFAHEYNMLWDTMKISKDMSWYKKRINQYRQMYKRAGKRCRVPWQIVAALHHLESNGMVGRQILNGEPWDKRTKLTPKGLGPWRSFEESCAEAFKLKESPDEWTIANTLFFCESWNGWGYRKYHSKDVCSPVTGHSSSPYLWSFTNHYVTGKYVRDGQFDLKAVSKQCGVSAILRCLNYQYVGL